MQLAAPTETTLLRPTAPAAVPGTAPTARSAVAVGSGWRLHDEQTAPDAIINAIAGARQVVNAEFFGIADAGKGARLTSALVDAAARGVEVNVIADFISLGSLPLGSFQQLRSKLERAGGNLVVTSRIPLSPRARDLPGLAHVDHRKIVTVDGRTAITGGMNFIKLTDSYADSMVELSGIAAARLAADQIDRWARVGGTVTERHRQSVADATRAATEPGTPDTSRFQVVTNAPEQARFDISNGYRELIRGAKQRLWIASPAISDRTIMPDIIAAAKRGVDVRIITPGAPLLGFTPLDWITRSHLSAVHEAGGTGYQAKRELHRKAIVADDETILSSYNLTARSRLYDHEIGVRSGDPAFVAAVAGELVQDMAGGRPFDPRTHTGIARRIGDLIRDRVTY